MAEEEEWNERVNKDNKKKNGGGGGGDDAGAGLTSFEEYREKSKAAGVM